MKYPVRESLTVIRDTLDPEEAWAGIVALCRATNSNAPWDDLITTDLEGDIDDATTWLDTQLEDLTQVKGLYLGLDTLNMREGKGKNIEIGGSSTCEPWRDEIDWVYGRNLERGEKHLIYGLYELREMYSSDEWSSVYSLCDYIFFLCYSGIVLAEAFERLDTRRMLLPVWGFHDGDLFALGRMRDNEFTRICR